MTTGTDISALYREFTDALTEVIASFRPRVRTSALPPLATKSLRRTK